MARRGYEIRLAGSLSPAAREALADMQVTTESSVVVLSGVLDQPALHELLQRVRALGFELLSVRPSGASPSA